MVTNLDFNGVVRYISGRLEEVIEHNLPGTLYKTPVNRSMAVSGGVPRNLRSTVIRYIPQGQDIPVTMLLLSSTEFSSTGPRTHSYIIDHHRHKSLLELCTAREEVDAFFAYAARELEKLSQDVKIIFVQEV